MFRKLVSNLSYSPSLIAEVSFYARRLRKEDATRRLTVLFVILALVIQSLAVFSAPESANASSEQDIIRGGVTSLSDLLIRYDHNEEDVKDIFTAAGISRSELAAAQPGKINANDNTYVMSRFGQLSYSGSEASLSYQRSTGGIAVRYFSPLALVASNSTSLDGWIGHSAQLGWFGVIKSNGGLATHGMPAILDQAKTSAATATKSVTAINLSQGSIDASTSAVKPLDKISYTLKISNPNSISVTTPLSVLISDALEYSTLIDNGGGTLNKKTGTLSWPQIQLAPGETQVRTFAVQVLNVLPATAVGQSNPASYNCKMTLVFGSALDTPVDCPIAKGVEGALLQLPSTGIGANIAFAVFVLALVVFFYIRTHQLKKEIRIIRHNFNTGII